MNRRPSIAVRKEIGGRLLAVRKNAGLSLANVETKSGGRVESSRHRLLRAR